MAWVRVDDAFCDHPKALAAGGAAVALWLEGLCYANRHLTDGFLPAYVVDHMRMSTRPSKTAAALVKAGLWDAVEGGYRIHDYLEHYDSAAAIKARRALDSARKRGAVPSGIQPESERIPEPRGRACVVQALDTVRIGSSLEADPPLPTRLEIDAVQEFSTWWRAHAASHGHELRLNFSATDVSHIHALVRAYSLDQLREAIKVWWESPHVTSRNVGFFKAQVAEVVAHVEQGTTGAFRAPKPRATRSANAAPDGSGCPHVPMCRTTRECIDRALAQGRQERESA